ncbi:MAG: hypothetical protein Q8P67_08380, partial [archaeon]|nr:hypothetical protein [archaeon]
MASKGELDELFELKTNFFLGNYQGAINEASALRQVSAPVLKEVYVYRSYIAMGDASMVLAEIDPQSEQTPVELQVVYALALIAANRREEGAALLLGLPQQLGGGEAPGEAASVLLAL